MDDMGGSYDFESIMHYGNFAFSNNEKPTMLSVKNPMLQFGQIAKLSPTDILQLNSIYDCKCEYLWITPAQRPLTLDVKHSIVMT